MVESFDKVHIILMLFFKRIYMLETKKFTVKFFSGCDLVGFHIEDYCINFVDCCQRQLGCRVNRKDLLVEYGGRAIIIRPLPIGIPFNRFVRMAEVAPKVLQINEKIVLGVDRLDYTKGLVHRLKTFEKLLEVYPEHCEKVIKLKRNCSNSY